MSGTPVAIALIGLAVGFLLGGLYVYRGFIHLARFLGCSRPVKATVMVVEGWVSDGTLAQASKLFWQDGYQVILTTGPPLLRGTFLSQYQTHAQLAAATLVALGIPTALVIPMPCATVTSGRTYTSALAVKQRLIQDLPAVTAINLVTMGCHARRSWYIYRRLFQPAGIRVGVIAYPNDGFDPAAWWQTSAGVRTVVGEWIAYLYVRLIHWQG